MSEAISPQRLAECEEYHGYACATLAEVRADRDRLAARVAELEGELAALKDTRPCGRTATHPPHKWMSARRGVQCAGVGDYTEPARPDDLIRCGITDEHQPHRWMAANRWRQCPGVVAAPDRAEGNDATSLVGEWQPAEGDE